MRDRERMGLLQHLIMKGTVAVANLDNDGETKKDHGQWNQEEGGGENKSLAHNNEGLRSGQGQERLFTAGRAGISHEGHHEKGGPTREQGVGNRETAVAG